jgi:hypothetical protein
MANLLPYDPGALPTRPAPEPGQQLQLEVAGLPPIKDRNRSIRNRNHPLHNRFLELRRVATAAMDGRAWVFGKVTLELTVRSGARDGTWQLVDYVSGIMDTLGGSSGLTFTFLPIVYEDDCQVDGFRSCWEESQNSSYSLRVQFL